jgi:PPM family protein phosphatase
VALRIVEQVGRSDVGRQRSANEDSLVIAPPFFAVADGMGGAKAGEVASATAIEVFGSERDSSEAAEAQLARIVREANRRIHALAVSEDSYRGMGTTLTAAKIAGDGVGLAHVGDSRAYLLRAGELEQLTRDHSLVAELERSGQITAEAAEHHPQRSIITRALGPEPDVEVDTYTIAGRDGDLFLICSDGLTSMISDDEVSSILRSAPSLEDAADALVRAANQSGGRDNITVVLFRLEEVGAGAPAPQETAEHQAVARAPGPDAPATATAPVARIEPRAPRGTAPARRKRRRPRIPVGPILVLFLVACVLLGAYYASQTVYFVGASDDGFVSVYRGLPYDLPAGVHLYSVNYESGTPVDELTPSQKETITAHKVRSKDDAQDLVNQLETGQVAAR